MAAGAVILDFRSERFYLLLLYARKSHPVQSSFSRRPPYQSALRFRSSKKIFKMAAVLAIFDFRLERF